MDFACLAKLLSGENFLRNFFQHLKKLCLRISIEELTLKNKVNLSTFVVICRIIHNILYKSNK